MSYSDLARNLDTFNDRFDDEPDSEDGEAGEGKIPDWYVGDGGRADEGDDLPF